MRLVGRPPPSHHWLSFADEPGVAVEPAEGEEGKGLMDKIGEGIKKLF
jgi:hypothetical protein